MEGRRKGKKLRRCGEIEGRQEGERGRRGRNRGKEGEVRSEEGRGGSIMSEC